MARRNAFTLESFLRNFIDTGLGLLPVSTDGEEVEWYVRARERKKSQRDPSTIKGYKDILPDYKQWFPERPDEMRIIAAFDNEVTTVEKNDQYVAWAKEVQDAYCENFRRWINGILRNAADSTVILIEMVTVGTSSIWHSEQQEGQNDEADESTALASTKATVGDELGLALRGINAFLNIQTESLTNERESRADLLDRIVKLSKENVELHGKLHIMELNRPHPLERFVEIIGPEVSAFLQRADPNVMFQGSGQSEGGDERTRIGGTIVAMTRIFARKFPEHRVRLLELVKEAIDDVTKEKPKAEEAAAAK